MRWPSVGGLAVGGPLNGLFTAYAFQRAGDGALFSNGGRAFPETEQIRFVGVVYAKFWEGLHCVPPNFLGGIFEQGSNPLVRGFLLLWCTFLCEYNCDCPNH
jgi:hypothetical protein